MNHNQLIKEKIVGFINRQLPKYFSIKELNILLAEQRNLQPNASRIKLQHIMYHKINELESIESSSKASNFNPQAQQINEQNSNQPQINRKREAENQIMQYISMLIQQIWANSKDLPNEINKIILQMSFSYENLFLLMVILYQISPKCSVQVLCNKHKMIIQANGTFSPQFAHQLQLLKSLIMMKSHIEWIIHGNTSQKHHLKIYQKLDLLDKIQSLTSFSKFRENDTELWSLRESFISKIKYIVLDLKIDRDLFGSIPTYFRIKQGQDYTNNNILINQNLSFVDIFAFIQRPYVQQQRVQDTQIEQNLRSQSQQQTKLFEQQQIEITIKKEDLDFSPQLILSPSITTPKTA